MFSNSPVADVMGLGFAASDFATRPKEAFEALKRSSLAAVRKFEERWRSMPTLSEQITAIGKAAVATPNPAARNELAARYSYLLREYEKVRTSGTDIRDKVNSAIATIRKIAEKLHIPPGALPTLGVLPIIPIAWVTAILAVSVVAIKWSHSFDKVAEQSSESLRYLNTHFKDMAPAERAAFVAKYGGVKLPDPDKLSHFFTSVSTTLVLAVAAVFLVPKLLEARTRRRWA